MIYRNNSIFFNITAKSWGALEKKKQKHQPHILPFPPPHRCFSSLGIAWEPLFLKAQEILINSQV
jgi:hypothetical protein